MHKRQLTGNGLAVFLIIVFLLISTGCGMDYCGLTHDEDGWHWRWSSDCETPPPTPPPPAPERSWRTGASPSFARPGDWVDLYITLDNQDINDGEETEFWLWDPLAGEPFGQMPDERAVIEWDCSPDPCCGYCTFSAVYQIPENIQVLETPYRVFPWLGRGAGIEPWVGEDLHYWDWMGTITILDQGSLPSAGVELIAAPPSNINSGDFGTIELLVKVPAVQSLAADADDHSISVRFLEDGTDALVTTTNVVYLNPASSLLESGVGISLDVTTANVTLPTTCHAVWDLLVNGVDHVSGTIPNVSVTFGPIPFANDFHTLHWWEPVDGDGNTRWYSYMANEGRRLLDQVYLPLNHNWLITYEAQCSSTIDFLSSANNFGEYNMWVEFWHGYGINIDAGDPSTWPSMYNVFMANRIRLRYRLSPNQAATVVADGALPLTQIFSRYQALEHTYVFDWANAMYQTDALTNHLFYNSPWRDITRPADPNAGSTVRLETAFTSILVHELAHTLSATRDITRLRRAYELNPLDFNLDHWNAQHTGDGSNECLFRSLMHYPMTDYTDDITSTSLHIGGLSNPHFCARHVALLATN